MSERVVVECPSCFAKLALADDSKLGKKLRCPKCSEVFVAECSEESVQRPQSSGSKRGVPKKRAVRKTGSDQRPPLMLIGMGVLVLLIGVGVGIWMLSSGPVPQPAAQVPASEQTSQTNPSELPASSPVSVATLPGQLPNEASNSDSQAVSAAAKFTLATRSVLDGRISLLVPQEFKVMDAEVLQAKYPGAQRPSLVFTNAAGSVNIAFSHTLNPMSVAQLPGAIPQLEVSFRQLVPEVDWIRSDTLTIDGVKWFAFEFRSQAVDMTIRNLLVGTSLDNRLLLITLNAPVADEVVWMPVANTIVQSLRLPRSPVKPFPSSLDAPFEMANEKSRKDETPVKPLPEAALGQGTVTIKISNLANGEQGRLLADQIRRATKSTSSKSASFGNQLTITVNGVGDLKVLAEALEMGEVTDINEAARTISIRANPTQTLAQAASKKPAPSAQEQLFEIKVSPKLKIVPLFSGPNSLVCSKDGKAALGAANGPMFMAGFESKAFTKEDRQRAVEASLGEMTKVVGSVLSKTAKSITLDGLEGVETQMESEDAKSGKKIIAIIVLLFDDTGTFAMSGAVNSDEREEYLPEFQTMIQSFKKKPR